MNKKEKLFDDMTEGEILDKIRKAMSKYPSNHNGDPEFIHDNCVKYGVNYLGSLIDKGHHTKILDRRIKEREVLIAHFLPSIHSMADELELEHRKKIFTWEIRKTRAVPVIEQSFAAVGIPIKLTCHRRIIRLDANLNDQFRASMMLNYNMTDNQEEIDALAVAVAALQNAATHIGHRLNITPLKSKF